MILKKIYLVIKFLLVLLIFFPKLLRKRYYATISNITDINDIDDELLEGLEVKNIIFDWEYTIAQPDAITIEKSFEKKFSELKKKYKIIILTNNHTLREEIKKYDVDVSMCKGVKPSKKVFEESLKGLSKKHTVYIGDSWLTDIIGANNIGLKAIKVEPLKMKEHNFRWFIGNIFRFIEEVFYKISF